MGLSPLKSSGIFSQTHIINPNKYIHILVKFFFWKILWVEGQRSLLTAWSRFERASNTGRACAPRWHPNFPGEISLEIAPYGGWGWCRECVSSAKPALVAGCSQVQPQPWCWGAECAAPMQLLLLTDRGALIQAVQRQPWGLIPDPNWIEAIFLLSSGSTSIRIWWKEWSISPSSEGITVLKTSQSLSAQHNIISLFHMHPTPTVLLWRGVRGFSGI